jgi:hypothetical protein
MLWNGIILQVQRLGSDGWIIFVYGEKERLLEYMRVIKQCEVVAVARGRPISCPSCSYYGHRLFCSGEFGGSVKSARRQRRREGWRCWLRACLGRGSRSLGQRCVSMPARVLNKITSTVRNSNGIVRMSGLNARWDPSLQIAVAGRERFGSSCSAR